MSFSFVVVDKNNQLNLTELKDFCNNICNDYEIIYCCSKNVEFNDVKYFVFNKNKNTEKILNTVLCKCTKQSIIVIRDAKSYKLSADLIKEYNSSNQIVCYKKQTNKFKSFLFDLTRLTIAKMLSHNLKAIDGAVVLYGEIASSVLKNIKSPSVLMRTNNLTGINYVFLNGENKYIFPYKKKELMLKTLIPFGLALLFIILYFAVFKINAIWSIFYFSGVLFLLVFAFIFGSKWILNSILGDTIREKAHILEQNNEQPIDNEQLDNEIFD